MMQDLTTTEYLKTAHQKVLFTSTRPGAVMERGQGMYLWDTDGKQYLDFIGGWAVTCLGHSPAAIKEALCSQAATLVNASPAFYNKPMVEFAKLLTDLSGFDRVFFASTGAEANESAIKLSRKYGSLQLDGAYEIITTVNGFHGRTLATMSATGKKNWKDLFAPKVSGFVHVPYNDIEAMAEAVSPKTCAIMLEPVQGEGGVHAATSDYLKALRKLCDEKGILLIFDEIQTGLGRLGSMFAYQHFGVKPDVMTLGKGIGGGFPLSAMLTLERFNIFEQGDQGGTYSSQPLAMAVGHAVVGEIVRQGLCENAKTQGDYLLKKLHELAMDLPISNIRGMGLLIAFDLPGAHGSELVAQCLEAGLLINSPQPVTLRLMPALIVRQEECDAMLAILARVLKAYYHKAA